MPFCLGGIYSPVPSTPLRLCNRRNWRVTPGDENRRSVKKLQQPTVIASAPKAGPYVERWKTCLLAVERRLRMDSLRAGIASKAVLEMIRVLITAVLLTFFAVPLAFIAYAALGGLLGGLAIIVTLGLLQWPIYTILRKTRRL